MSKGAGGEEGEGTREARSSNFLSKITIVKRSIVRGSATIAHVPSKPQSDQSQEEHSDSRRATTIVSHTGNGVEDKGGRFSAFIRKVSTAKTGTTKGRGDSNAGQVFGVARQSPLVNAIIMR